MALLFSEGWDAYTTTSDVTGSGKYKVFRTSNNGGPQLLSSSGKYGAKPLVLFRLVMLRPFAAM